MSEDFEIVKETKESARQALLDALLASSALSSDQLDAVLCERCEFDDAVAVSLFYKSACVISTREFGIPSRRQEIVLLASAFAAANCSNLEDPDPRELELLAEHRDSRPMPLLEPTLERLARLFTYEAHSHEAGFLDELAQLLETFESLDMQLAVLAASEDSRRRLQQYLLSMLGHLRAPEQLAAVCRLQHVLASRKVWTEATSQDIVAPVQAVCQRVEQLNRAVGAGRRIQWVDRLHNVHSIAAGIVLEDPINLYLEYRVVAVEVRDGRFELVTCDDEAGKLHGTITSVEDGARHMLVDEKFINPMNSLMASVDFAAVVENSKAREVDCLLVDGLTKSDLCAFAPSDRRVLLENVKSLLDNAHAAGLKVLLNVSLKLSSGHHAKRYKRFKLSTVSGGRELPVYQSFGRCKDEGSSWLPNMADLRAWDCFLEDLQFLLDTFDLDGLNLDLGHLLPILYRRDYAELARRDSDGSMYHSIEDRLLGRYVLDGIFVPLPLEAAHPHNIFLDFLTSHLRMNKNRKLILTCDYSHLRRRGALDLQSLASVMRSGFIPKVNVVELLQARNLEAASHLRRFQGLMDLQAELPVDGPVFCQTSGADTAELADLVAHDLDVYAVFLFLMQGSLLSYDCEVHRVLRRQHRCNFYEIVKHAHDYGTHEVAKTRGEESGASTLTPK